MPIVVLLVVVALVSLLITRVATIALTVTGMTRPAARFQARSALTGVGFTTRESEAVATHPVRRRIIMALMLVGNLGLTTAVAGLLAGFLGTDNARQVLLRGVLLVGGLALVYALSLSQAVDRRLSRLAGRALRRFTDLDVRDYAALLRVSGEYEVQEMIVDADSWLAGRKLGDLRLRDEGIMVLGIVRPDDSYLGVPDKQTEVRPGDTLILYGRVSSFEDLTRRAGGPSGDEAHARAVDRQRQVTHEDRRHEPY
ncbi:MAG: TrkA C-terminal domain-containing protein [Actinomycetota bacterium]|nr:TrkA C-terminal domain-containing protein [Actinomycetota bacterium]